MKNNSSQRRFGLLPLSAILLLGLVTFPGCALLQWLYPNSDQARIEKLNDEIRLASLPNPTLPDHPTERARHWHKDAEVLARFIDKYKQTPALADRLRIRLAKLYLQNRQFEMAKVTLEEVSPHSQLSPRDRTFWALREATIWWWTARSHGFGPISEYEDKAPQYIEQIAKQVRQLEDVPENYRIREHYAEMAVHIANYLVPTTIGSTDGEQLRTKILPAYELFAETVGPEAIHAAASGGPIDPKLVRRVEKAKMVSDRIREAFSDRRQGRTYTHLCKLSPQYIAFEQLIVR